MSQYITSITVCRYMLEKKKLSIRAMARALKIHHKTLQRYLNGTSNPTRYIKHRMAKLMLVTNYTALINLAFEHYRGKRTHASSVKISSGNPSKRINNSKGSLI